MKKEQKELPILRFYRILAEEPKKTGKRLNIFRHVEYNPSFFLILLSNYKTRHFILSGNDYLLWMILSSYCLRL